jgi:ATP-dependent protease ClpP protease subunit
MAQIIAFHSGQPIEKVRRDLDRDYFMDAAGARDYGIVDEVLGPRRGISQELLELADAAASGTAGD